MGCREGYIVSDIARTGRERTAQLAHIACIVRHMESIGRITGLERCVSPTLLRTHHQHIKFVLPGSPAETDGLPLAAHRIAVAGRTVTHTECHIPIGHHIRHKLGGIGKTDQTARRIGTLVIVAHHVSVIVQINSRIVHLGWCGGRRSRQPYGKRLGLIMPDIKGEPVSRPGHIAHRLFQTVDLTGRDDVCRECKADILKVLACPLIHTDYRLIAVLRFLQRLDGNTVSTGRHKADRTPESAGMLVSDEAR